MALEIRERRVFNYDPDTRSGLIQIHALLYRFATSVLPDEFLRTSPHMKTYQNNNILPYHIYGKTKKEHINAIRTICLAMMDFFYTEGYMDEDMKDFYTYFVQHRLPGRDETCLHVQDSG